MDYEKEYEKWVKYADDKLSAQDLTRIANDDEEIKSRFSSVLEFGTAGFRGRIGAGTNRMNVHTVKKASQGLADYINESCGKRIAITYDTRHYSDEFALAAALVFAANDIETFMFGEPTGVSELSFAVRELGCCAGVAITASHNPPDYNGYKVYASWGGQILGDVGVQISKNISKVDGYFSAKTMDESEAKKAGLLKIIEKSMDEKYYDSLLEAVNDEEMVKEYSGKVKVVYTPLFGTGLKTFMGVVDKLGYDYEIVEQQKYPNPDFPGLSTPNPEDSTAMKMAIDMAVQKKADIAFGTDPDSDRFGAAIPNEEGEYVLLTGNQVGCIITDYLLRSRKKKGLLEASDYIIRSFVSTHMVDEMAQRFGIECAVVPTGFKHFSDLVHNKYTDRHFIFGFEESCGYMGGYKVADKDGMLAAALMLEVMCECRKKGISMFEHLTELFEEYGWYKENVVSVYHEEDLGKSKRIMDEIRNSPPKEVAGQMVMGIKDHLETEDQNMITFTLEKGWLSVRPSGTEPKIKLYYGVNEKTNSASQALLESIDRGVEDLISSWK